MMCVRHKVILFIIVTGLASCSHKKTLFESLPSSQTGIEFINKVEENDKYNVLDYMNIYTGAGVAAGDINNDGLVDLYFSGNENSGKLYINKGNFIFDDITVSDKPLFENKNGIANKGRPIKNYKVE